MPLGVRPTAWYLKQETTFSDELAGVKRVLWAGKYCNKSTLRGDHMILNMDEWERLLDQLASTA